jgi:hypothetical protein
MGLRATAVVRLEGALAHGYLSTVRELLEILERCSGDNCAHRGGRLKRKLLGTGAARNGRDPPDALQGTDSQA